MDADTMYHVAFSVFPGIGPVRFRLLAEYFGSAREAWHASEKELGTLHIPSTLLEEFFRFRREFSPESYMKDLREKNISVVTAGDPRYPVLLKEIPDAPFVLYILGKRNVKPIDFTRTVGVVGTRRITPYGVVVTRSIVEGLVSYGCTIVSGLAYGVDAVAHKSAIEAGGTTIAVLGCGVDVIAPPSNTALYRDIASGHGAIVSEMPLGLRPNKGLFPARNRIISGLSLGIVVTEGAQDSGALITARNATEQGREVFAVPGPITSPMSSGPARLLKNGAKLVESADDIMEEFGFKKEFAVRTQLRPSGDSPIQQHVLDALETRPMHIDELARILHLTISEVGSTITVLEMQHKVRDSGEKEYSLI